MKIEYFLLIFFLSLTTVSAISSDSVKLGPFKQNQFLNLTLTCIHENGTQCNPSPATLCNITYLQYPAPDSRLLLINKIMTQPSYPLWNITIPDTSLIGTYMGEQLCCDGPECGTQSFYYQVTGSGNDSPSTGQAILYLFLFLIASVFFIGSLIAGFLLPGNNETDAMTGYIISVNNLKYVKLFSFAISYLMLMLMFYTGWQISYLYLDLDALTNLFKFAFYFMLATLLPFFIVGTYILIANWIRDSKIKDVLLGGGRIKDGYE